MFSFQNLISFFSISHKRNLDKSLQLIIKGDSDIFFFALTRVFIFCYSFYLVKFVYMKKLFVTKAIWPMEFVFILTWDLYEFELLILKYSISLFLFNRPSGCKMHSYCFPMLNLQFWYVPKLQSCCVFSVPPEFFSHKHTRL